MSKKFIYLICPVRGISEEYKSKIDDYVAHLEKSGNKVYYPPRDTDQSASELKICLQNKDAILQSDEVHVIWDGKSQGCLFDLGIAFATKRNKIKAVIGFVPRMTVGEKSFQNLIYQLDELSD